MDVDDNAGVQINEAERAQEEMVQYTARIT
jgi:hypothetical protein